MVKEERTGFRDRTEAGLALADALAPLVSRRSIVAAIPRGGVVVAAPIARRLGAPLTCSYARKLSAPIAPEVAFGALDEDGEAVTDREMIAALGLGPDDVERIKARVGAEIRRRMAAYPVRPLARYLPGVPVLLVDDGLATGLTVEAALRYARRHGATEVTVAAPCASAHAADRFRREADRFVSLIVDEAFAAVGEYYADFSPVSDEEVIRVLASANTDAEPATRAEGLGVSFRNSRGLRLAGELLVPEGPGPHPVVVVAPGGAGKDSPESRRLAQTLWAEGLAAFLFDWTGHGDSEGAPEQCTTTQQVEDLDAAVDALTTLDELDMGRVALAGIGSGIPAAVTVAAGDARIRAVACFSAEPSGASAGAAALRVPVLRVMDERDAALAATWLRTQMT